MEPADKDKPTASLLHQPATVAMSVLLAITSQNAKDHAEMQVAQALVKLDLQHQVNMYSYEMLMHRRAHLYSLVAAAIMCPGPLPISRNVVESYAKHHAAEVNKDWSHKHPQPNDPNPPHPITGAPDYVHPPSAAFNEHDVTWVTDRVIQNMPDLIKGRTTVYPWLPHSGTTR